MLTPKQKGESENMEYTHMKCDCGGIIGMRDKENFSCDKCGKGVSNWERI